MLFKLNFDLQWISPITFLERFERLFNLDQKYQDSKTNKIALKAKDICGKTLLHTEFLAFRPSQIAAASLIYAISIYTVPNTTTMDFGNSELGFWTEEIESMTQIDRTEDLQPVYTLLKAKISSPDWT